MWKDATTLQGVTSTTVCAASPKRRGNGRGNEGLIIFTFLNDPPKNTTVTSELVSMCKGAKSLQNVIFLEAPVFLHVHVLVLCFFFVRLSPVFWGLWYRSFINHKI